MYHGEYVDPETKEMRMRVTPLDATFSVSVDT